MPDRSLSLSTIIIHRAFGDYRGEFYGLKLVVLCTLKLGVLCTKTGSPGYLDCESGVSGLPSVTTMAGGFV